MSQPDFDLVIMGAGPVGSALALMLARYSPDPARIALVGTQFFATDTLNSPTDPRTIALNHGSQVALQALNAWPSRCSPITTVHVSQRQRLGRTLVQHDDFGVPQLGCVVAYPDLLVALHAALEKSGVTRLKSRPVTLAFGNPVELHPDTGPITAHLAVQSDGAKPKGIERNYAQAAVLATVTASEPRQGWAFERFTRQGPLAVLPHPSGEGHYGVVWCCHPDQAQALMHLAPAQFNAALNDTFGTRLGRLTLNGNRQQFPLGLNAGPLRTHARGVAIGNAAQTLHPVAGQGLNLGLRDASQLAHALRFWLANPSSDPTPLLDTFTGQRRIDRWATAAITDVLPRIFATGNPLVEHACGLGLLAMDLSHTLRTPLATHLLQGIRT
ncbi:monooxygenase [Pusillimonas sp. T2]|uniref:FAD-dependent monooxygenase n=1 Tax=Pusillimonas sp. T2 TaxID=1548123 RepID=UPI000B9C8F15|nr:FAD-dependent monooxygenase [Pusillimonas sp. T2]OXR50562.1 monooxygenase [Pusillimonas sp. T2]